MTHAHDVLGIGNAIVDVLAHTDDVALEATGLVKGSMTLVDAEASAALYARMGQGVEVSGGSCANSAAALASLGGRAAYIGRVRDDQLGAVFRHDIRASGVTFENAPSQGGPSTARCLIFVTAEGQRTMATYLGACVELSPDDVDEALVRSAGITYLEGYLWDRPEAKAACLKAAEIARQSGNRVALSLSDSFCVDRWRAEFRDLILRHVDVVFANEDEITSLYEGASFEAAAERVRADCGLAALTRGAEGCVVVSGEGAVTVPQEPVAAVLDTTGAGDAFAAGFLHGLGRGLSHEACGRLGCRAAAAVIGHYGARSPRPLAPLARAMGIGRAA